MKNRNDKDDSSYIINGGGGGDDSHSTGSNNGSRLRTEIKSMINAQTSELWHSSELAKFEKLI